MANRRLIFAAALLLLLAILLLWGAGLPVKPAPQSVSLPGGSILTFAGTSYGQKVALAPTGFWRRKLAFLPDSILRRLKIDPLLGIPMSSNHLVIWMMITPAGSPGLFQAPAVSFSLMDENGVECYSPNYLPWGFPYSAAAKGSSLQALDLAAFPRRGKNFKLRVYSKDSQNKLSILGEMNIPNPASRSYSSWQPASLPVAQTNGDVVITFTKLVTGISQFDSKPAATNEEAWGEAFFTFARGGKPRSDWAVDTIEFSDATGNETPPSAWNYNEQEPNRGVFWFRNVLWPAESAWKLNVTFKRRPGAKFAAGELWSLTHLPLPALNSTNSFNLETNINGVSLKFLSVSDESGLLPPETFKDYRRIRLNFYVSPLPPNFRFDIVSAPGDGIGTENDPGGRQSYLYALPASARTLDVKTAVYRQLTAEYLVKPTLVTASNSVSAGSK